MKYFYPEIGLGRLCGLFGKSRQGYYNWQKQHNGKLLFEAVIAEMIEDIRGKLKNKRLGGRKLQILINEKLSIDAMQIGRDKLYRIMSEKGLLVRRRSRKAKTTDSNHKLRCYENLVKGKQINSPEEVWVSDITYIRVGSGFNYLSIITDAYSRKVMGFSLYPNLSANGPHEALLMALSKRIYPDNRLIHHSDQGVQYCSYNYVSLLEVSRIKISMTKKGSPQENAIAERVNGILKGEYELGKTISNHNQACKLVEQAIESYNKKRPHRSLNMMTPEQMHNSKLWKDYREFQRSKTGITKQCVKQTQD